MICVLAEAMDKDGIIRVRRKPSKRRRSNGFAKAVTDYLASDCYMYAPLLDLLPADSSASAASPASVEQPGLHSQIRTRRSVSFHTETVSLPSDERVSVVQLQRLISK